jgi:glutaconate CoA-transferase subunit B
MMIVAAARALAGARTVFVGVGLPNLCCNLARLTVAPDLELIYESGVYGARPEVIPMSDLFGFYLQGGRIDVALVGAAQIDRYGNLNSTVIGDYAAPKVRLPGSGGACEIAINARALHCLMRLSPRAFVERLDFVTSPGHLDGGDARRRMRMPGRGPTLVVTDRAVFDFGARGSEMRLQSLHAGETLEAVRAGVAWSLATAPEVAETPPPTDEELRLIAELDPRGVYRKT